MGHKKNYCDYWMLVLPFSRGQWPGAKDQGPFSRDQRLEISCQWPGIWGQEPGTRDQELSRGALPRSCPYWLPFRSSPQKLPREALPQGPSQRKRCGSKPFSCKRDTAATLGNTVITHTKCSNLNMGHKKYYFDYWMLVLPLSRGQRPGTKGPGTIVQGPRMFLADVFFSRKHGNTWVSGGMQCVFKVFLPVASFRNHEKTWFCCRRQCFQVSFWLFFFWKPQHPQFQSICA